MKLVTIGLLGLTLVSYIAGAQTPPPAPSSDTVDPAQVSAKPTLPATDGLSEFRATRYKKAAPLLQDQLAKEPGNALMAAHLLTSYVHLGRLAEADALATDLEQRFPNSSDATSARGDLAFFRGNMALAQSLYIQALKTNEKTARAYYGLYRVFRAASMYRTARLRILRAYEIDRDDRAIYDVWYSMLTPAKRAELAQTDRELTGDEELARDFHFAVDREINGRKVFEPVKPAEPVVLKLGVLGDPRHTKGVSIGVVINGAKQLHLEFDTGSHGILISERAAERVGLKLVGNSEAWGLGDQGTKVVHGAIADNCEIGQIEYKNCFIEAMEGKHVADEDGLFGPDVLANYIMTIDFQRLELQLTPQPPREPTSAGYDRIVPDNEKDFTPIFRFGHFLMITTSVNDKETGLFLLDSGSSSSLIDNGFAREVTKTSHTDNVVLKGISGKANEVFEADKAVLTFSHFRQRAIGLLAADLNHMDAGAPQVRMAGIMGLPLLALFRLTLDYRNGLVHFDYVYQK
jgi:predicted aspartyl protease